jgi:hypothetical protein
MHVRVSNPPPKPLMIWDGECHFCKRWIERWREITVRKFRSNNSNARSLSSNQMAKPFLPLKLSIARYVIDLPEDGWLGVMIVYLDSRQLPNLLTSISLVIAAPALRLPDCSGAMMCVHRHIHGLGAGFFERSASFT